MEEQSEVCEVTEKRVVLLAMDGSDDSKNAMNWYIENVRQKNDEVVIVHNVHHTAHYSMGLWAPVDGQIIARAFQEETDHAAKLCSKFQEFLKKSEIEGKVVVTTGDPGSQIVRTAEEVGAQLIVTGSRGLGTIRRTVLGSVSDYIVHHSNVPVIICRK